MCETLTKDLMGPDASVKQKTPQATFDGQNNARFMEVLKDQGVTVAMRHMKG